MELKFKNSNMTCLNCPDRSRIEEVCHGYEYYEPQELYWGIKTDTITVDMVEIEKNNNHFEIKPTVDLSVRQWQPSSHQPIVKVGYDALKAAF
ncbi:MAG: hypothetical protein ACLT8H_10025 [Streptococcus parasanguinis]